jgi:hypothetical protein
MLFDEAKIILDLCGGTGAWSKPYRDAGYDVRVITLPGQDVREYIPTQNVYGVLAAPPCNDLAASGARWWKGKGKGALLNALSIADACMRIILLTNPVFWALENPVGRLRDYYGDPLLIFHPCDYGDPYTKKTLIWGDFNLPEKSPVDPIDGSKMHLMSPSEDRAELRSVTPKGFAKAFFEANR